MCEAARHSTVTASLADVVCVCVQEEMRRLADERDGARKALRASHAATRKEKEELLQCKRREAELQLQIQALKQDAASSNRNATRALAQARVLASSSASHAEVCGSNE